MQSITIRDYNYELPEERIAKYPLEERANSKLLLYHKGSEAIQHDQFKNIGRHLPKNTLLVFNNTRVIPARLHFFKDTGAAIEIFCLEPYAPKQYETAMQAQEQASWICMLGNAKKWKQGNLKKTVTINGKAVCVRATKMEHPASDKHIINFSWDYPIPFVELIQHIGEVPIPPYLGRESEEIDKTRYQTIYSKAEGSVAAPTAGLHFTPELIAQLEAQGIQTAEVTLHVGAGTFLPVKTENALEHPMHNEHFYVSRETLHKIQQSDCIIAVGTTSARTLESLYWLGIQPCNNQVPQFPWKKEQAPSVNKGDAINTLLDALDTAAGIHASTQIMIAPGYNFTLCQGIITNFHQPQSTLLLLIAALVGEAWKDLYTYAMKHNFRFLSYGDSSLLLANKG